MRVGWGREGVVECRWQMANVERRTSNVERSFRHIIAHIPVSGYLESIKQPAWQALTHSDCSLGSKPQ